MKKSILVTRPSLAPLSELLPYLEEIWASGMLTNDGPMVRRFEQSLAEYLQVADVVCVNNGTNALQLSLRALELEGEIITTPFTFIATANAVLWEHCKPVFADICPDTWNIDPGDIEARITEKTSAILAVHVFGRPCDTAALSRIATEHGLRLVYDAAHAIAVTTGDDSIMRHGDASIVSFHATKALNTAEGGACITDNSELAEKLRKLRFFGFDSDKRITGAGTNAKMSEICAALGLANLGRMDRVLQDRKTRYELYLQELQDLPRLRFQSFKADEYNYVYMPVLLDSDERVRAVTARLEENAIYPRRYFYPALHRLDLFGRQERLPVAEDIAQRILCLPLYDSLAEADIRKICSLVRECC